MKFHCTVQKTLWPKTTMNENHYYILSAKPEEKELFPENLFSNGYNNIVVKGNFFFVPYEGCRLEIEGELKAQEQGQFVQVKGYKKANSESGDEVLNILLSGIIKGIGPKTAHKIFKYYGKDSLKIIKDHPEKLSKKWRGPGISKKKAEVISKSYKESKRYEEAYSLLSKYHISLRRIKEVVEKLGASPKEAIEKDPYVLCDILGEQAGFHAADKIAAENGFSPYSERRLEKALKVTFIKAMSAGHTYLPVEEVKKSFTQILKDSAFPECLGVPSTMMEILGRALQANIVKYVQVNEKGQRGFYLAENRQNEIQCAAVLRRLSSETMTDQISDMDKFMKKAEKEIPFDETQKAAILGISSHKICVITGGPGTGKSTIIKTMIDALEQSKRTVLLAAPTGRAAKRMTETTGRAASTLHRMLEFNPATFCFERNETNPLNGDALIIDESSMIDTELLKNTLNAMPANMQLVLVGDVDQLPSVGAGACLKDIIDSGVIKTYRLTSVHRQGESSAIVKNSKKILAGDLGLDMSKRATFSFMECPTKKIPEKIVALSKRAYSLTGSVNDFQVLCLYRKKKSGIGSTELNRTLQDQLNPSQENAEEYVIGRRIFRKGDKVMQTQNNYDKQVFNGDIGEVVHCDSEAGKVVIYYDTYVNPETGKQGEQIEYSAGELEQVELAYAITVHKSQGSECPYIFIPLSMDNRYLLTRNVLYTAVTRAKTCVCLVGEREALEYAIQNKHTAVRYTGLKWLLSK